MAEPKSMIAGASLDAPAEDFKSAARVEQYRLSAKALYIPAGFRWNYIPFTAVESAEESHRSITAGKCVAVTEKRPTLLLKTTAGEFSFPMEKPESLRRMLETIKGEG